MRPISRVASSEWPPSSKKLSSMPTSATPSVSANSAHSTASCGVRGSRPLDIGGHHRRRQRPAVELAVRRQRQPLQHHERRRHHVVGQQPGEMLPQRRRIGRRRAGLRHHVGHQPQRAGAASAAAIRASVVVGIRPASLRAITAACATPHAAATPPRSRPARSGSRAASPAHRRGPRKSSTPSLRQRARSPVRYIRLPAGPNGSATNRSAVRPARPR